MNYLRIRNWEKWQSYRQDRGAPGWIKVHRRLLTDPEWILLSDTLKGQLTALWLLASERNGLLPDDKDLLRVLCHMSEECNLAFFKERKWVEKQRKRRQPRKKVWLAGDNQEKKARGHVDNSPPHRVEEKREEEKEDLVIKTNTEPKLSAGDPPLDAPRLEAGAPAARNGGNGKEEKLEAYRAQAEALGLVVGDHDTLETLAAALAARLTQP